MVINPMYKSVFKQNGVGATELTNATIQTGVITKHQAIKKTQHQII